jgi:hypothetical protein
MSRRSIPSDWHKLNYQPKAAVRRNASAAFLFLGATAKVRRKRRQKVKRKKEKFKRDCDRRRSRMKIRRRYCPGTMESSCAMVNLEAVEGNFLILYSSL